MVDITSDDFKQLIESQKETNKLLRLEQASESKPNPEKFIKEELVNIAIGESNRRSSKKLVEVETKEEESDKKNQEENTTLQLRMIEGQERANKTLIALSATDDLVARTNIAEAAAKAEETEKNTRNTKKQTDALSGMGNFFKFFKKTFYKIPGSKSLMAILKGTLFGGALLGLLYFLQRPEFGKILAMLVGPIATGLAFLWENIISPIGNFLMGVGKGVDFLKELGKDFGFSEESTNNIIGVLRGLAGVLTVGFLFAPMIATGLLVGGVWKFTKLVAGIGAISKLFSTLGTATTSLGATATTATAGISATAVKVNNKRIKAAVRANPRLGKGVISNAGNVVRQFTASGAVNPTFAPTQRAFNQRMSGAQPAKLPGRFGRFAAIPIIGRLFAAGQLYDILTSGQSTAQMIPQVAGVFGGLGGASLGALVGATMGATMTLNPLGGFIGSLLGGAVGYYAGDKLAMGLSQFMLGQPVTVLSDSMNESINSAGDPSGVMESPAVAPYGPRRGGRRGPSIGGGRGLGRQGAEITGGRGKVLPSSGGQDDVSMKLNPIGEKTGDAFVVNSQDSIDNSVTNQSHHTFATPLSPIDSVLAMVGVSK